MNKGVSHKDVLKEGYTSNLPGIESASSGMTKAKQNSNNQGDGDIQYNLNALVPPQKMLEGARFILSAARHADFFFDPLLRVTFWAAIRLSIALATRGENIRFARLATMFTKQIAVGPDGETALAFVVDQGKQTRSGRLATSAVLPHMNPLLCAIFAIGLMLTYRFYVHMETTPDVCDYKSLFGTYLFRSTENWLISMSYETMLAIWTAFFTYMRCVVNALTHYGRHEGAQTLDELGLEEATIHAFMKTYQTVSQQAYLLGFKLKALLGLSGRDPDNKRAAGPPHMSVYSDVPISTVYLLWPFLEHQQANVDAANRKLFETDATEGGGGEAVQHSRRKRKAKSVFAAAAAAKNKLGLYSAEGALNAFIHIGKVFILCSAARPRLVSGFIDLSSQPLHLLFSSNPVFRLTFFQTSEFMHICRLVAAAENFAESAEDIAVQPLADMSPATARITAAVRSVIAPALAAQNAMMQQLLNRNIFASTVATDTPMHTPAQHANAASGTVIGEGTSEQQLPQGRFRASRAHGVGSGHHSMLNWRELHDVSAFNTEFFIGINGQPSLESLEAKGATWRDYKGGRQRFCEKKKVASYLKQLKNAYGEVEALSRAQRELDAVPKKGNSKGPNWAAFIEIISPSTTRAKANTNKEVIVELRSDGSQVEGLEAPRMHENMADGTGI